MSRIEIPNYDFLNDVVVTEIKYTDEQIKAIEEANKNIEEAKHRRARACINARNFIAGPGGKNDDYNMDLEDLVANLFYTLRKNNIDDRQISYDLITKYEYILHHEFQERNITCWFTLSRYLTYQFLKENSDMFIETPDGNGIEIFTDYLTVDNFINRYQSALPDEIVDVVRNKEVMNKTIETYKEEKEKNKVLSI